jgi:hypothetical protein
VPELSKAVEYGVMKRIIAFTDRQIDKQIDRKMDG